MPTLARLKLAGADCPTDGSTIKASSVNTLNIGMSDVNLFLGYGIPDLFGQPLSEQDGVYGLAVNNVDLGLSIMTAVNTKLKLPQVHRTQGQRLRVRAGRRRRRLQTVRPRNRRGR